MILKASIAAIVVAVGLNATLASAFCVLRQRGRLFRLSAAMFLAAPATAVLLALSFDLHPAVELALVALSVSPVPPLLPRKAFRAGGTPEYVVGLYVASSLLAVGFAPAWVAVCSGLRARPILSNVAAVALQVLTAVLLPLAVGMLVRRLAPQVAHRAARPLSMAGTLLLAAAALPILIGARHILLSLVGNGTVLALAFFALTALLAGHAAGGPDPDERTVLALSTASRHPGMAVAIALANVPEETLVAPAVVVYLIVSAIVCLPYARGAAAVRESARTS